MNDINNPQPVALKEWAVAVKALAEGRQIIVLRKGGIAEETRDFQLVSRRFYLLPAYEHQRMELLKDDYQDRLKDTLKEASPDRVRISVCAEVVEDIEIYDMETLDKVRECHIWTDSFAEERLKWKKKKPLHLLILRIGRLEHPVDIPMRDAYTGCKSWVTLEDGLQENNISPVLSDAAFQEQASRIHHLLNL
ncbi:DUF1802 family protein [Paenibacillus sepulcri]|uniref:DUF1802 family protein n=1 Tax=Paenibacillus sepulcri TaxID=359917 RepID=UPI0035E783E3